MNEVQKKIVWVLKFKDSTIYNFTFFPRSFVESRDFF